ncbi:sensor histidine kinase [uncultured Desulfosarcina sp.]|uniref:sensor histidine kinase n=1 Tax=uncultured Desulfosarcina sp. TaxID=218289 RepID=UPI0029C67AAD|nr:sensor histidine kinase [uncultured Desulfosarcina sp.]
MISILATPTRGMTTGCRHFGAAALLLAPFPANAAGSGDPMHGSIFWVFLWVVVLLAAIFLGYLQQNRMVRRKTAELRRELFERQMAEKELLAADHKLRQSLAEKESLLKEIHHRVKNNLQIVSSLLYLQEDYMKDAKGVEILRESQNRVKSMALIHEQLYGTSDLAKIDFGHYIKGLTANLFDAYGIDPTRIRLNVRADDIALGVDMAVPCGLIINELVSNALKHAFLPDASGTIDIVIRTLDGGRVEIGVADDGIGLVEPPADVGKKSLGLRLIDTLTTQMDGTLAIKTENGTRFSITLNAPERPQKEF